MKTEKIRKAKGSVLFTVVAVMTLLVVFLAGTMILVSSANHRSHINYSTAQTTVTSRTVAESTLKALTLSPKNEAYEDYFFSVNKDNPRIEIPVSIDASDVNAELGTMGKIENVVVTYEGTMNFYSNGSADGLVEGESAEKGWKERDVIKVMATVNMGRASSSTAIYLVVDPPNGDPGTGGGGAGFVTTGGAGMDCQTSLYGGAYINIPELADAKNFNYSNPASYLADYNAATGKAGYTMHMQNEGSVAEADTVVNGNLSMENFNGFIFPASGKGITVWGDMMFSSNNHFNVYVNKDNFPASINFNQIPYIYVDGEMGPQAGNTSADFSISFKDANSADFKNATPVLDVPFNIFCGNFNAGSGSNNSKFDINADIYCMDAGKDSVIGATNGANLHSWTASVVNKTLNTGAKTYYGGNFYSKGNLLLNGGDGFELVVDGDLRIEGDLTFKNIKSLTVNGDLVVGGNILAKEKNNNNDTTIPISKIKIGKKKNGEQGHIYCSGSMAFTDTVTTLKPGYSAVREPDLDNYTKYENYTGSWIQWNLDEGVPVANKSNTATYEVTKQEDKYEIVRKGLDGSVTDTIDAAASPIYLAADLNKIFYLYGTDEIDNEGSTAAIENVWETATYLVEADKSGNPIGEDFTDEEYWYAANSDGDAYPVHYNEDEITVVKYYDADHNEVSRADAFTSAGEDVRSKAEYKYSSIYPKYAEKMVIIGKQQIKNPSASGNLPKTETQVVKTMEEVLNNVVNPYNAKGYPSQYSKAYTVDKTLPVYDSFGDIYNDNLWLCTTDVENNDDYKLKKIDYTKSTENSPITNKETRWNPDLGEYGENETIETPSEDISKLEKPGLVTITKSCILRDFKDDPKRGNAIVVNPELGDIFIAIESTATPVPFDYSNPSSAKYSTVTFSNGLSFIIDDVNSTNKVYFYIADGCAAHFSQGAITTVKYKALVESGDSVQVITDKNLKKSGVETLADKGMVAPTVYIYGGENSGLKMSDFKGWFAGNIVSPDLALRVDSTNGGGISNDIYYNGTDISKVDSAGLWAMFGCCNSENAKIPNKVKVIYTPDAGKKKEELTTEDRSHWLKTLYYDEF